MSSTSNVQDLLVNVFRPTYTYAPETGFVPSLTVSNVTEVIATRVKTSELVVSDSNLNTYIGSNAGVNATNTLSNLGIGYSAMGGAVNCSRNVALGAFSLNGLLNSDCNVAIGTGTDLSSGAVGARNVLIGTNVRMAGGSNNILIGVDISRGTIQNQLQIGRLLYGDLSSGFVGINIQDPSAALDISGVVVFRDKVGFQNPNPVYSLDVNGSVAVSDRFVGGNGTKTNPLYTFSNSSNTGMFVPAADTSVGVGMSATTVGSGAFGISVNANPAAIFSSNKVRFFQDLDVSGTFSACNVNINAFSVVDGTAATPSMTFTNDLSVGLFRVAAGTLGVTTAGVRRMAVLSNGDVSMGRILVSDVSASGALFSSAGSNNIGGVTLSNGFVITSGTTTSSNLLVPGYLRNADPATTLDISGGTISNSALTRSSNFRGSNGSVSVPTYSFVSDSSTGLHLVGGSALGFDTAGVLRMCLSGGFLGIGTAAPRVALDVSGDISANVYNGPGGTAGAPHYTFSDDRTTGVFFPGANSVGFTAGGTERMRISNANVGIGTTAPTNALDVSGTLRVIGTAGDLTFSNGTISLAGVPVISSTGVLSNGATTSNSIGGVVLSNSNAIVGGFLRNALTPTTLDISGGNLSNSGVHTTTGLVGTYLRNTLTPSTYDISGGNISNSGTTRSSTFLAAPGGAPRPAYGFTTDPSSGLDLVGTSYLAFDTGGVQRMCISGASVGIGTPAPLSLLDLSDGTLSIRRRARNADTTASIEVGGGYDNGGNGGTAALAFQFYDGGYRHFLRSRHSPGPSFANAIDFFLNSGIGDASSSAPGVHNLNMMSVTSAGVGIGTSTPNSNFALDVSGGINSRRLAAPTILNWYILSDASGTGAGFRYGVGLLGTSTIGNAGGDLAITAYDNANAPIGSTPQVLVKRSNGFVGIGTSTPAHLLDVNGGAGGTVTARIYSGETVAGSSNNIPRLRLTSRVGTGAVLDYDITGEEVVGSANNYGLTFGGYGNANVFRMDFGNRRFGIGTTAPSSLLHIQKSTNYDGGVSTDGTPYGIYFSAANNSDAARILAVDRSTAGGAWKNELAFYTKFDATSAERVRISGEGNVGIGTVSPGYTLDVNGTARATSVLIGSGASPTMALSRVYTRTGLTTSAGGVSITSTGTGTLASYTDSAFTNGTYLLTMIAKISTIVTSTGAAGGDFYLGGRFNGNTAVYGLAYFCTPASSTTFTAGVPITVCGVISNATSSTTFDLLCQRSTGGNSATVTGELNEIHLMRIA